jgi:hypothetical protein
MPRSWCKFCEEHHEESTCEVKKNARDKIFGKRPKATIVFLEFAEPEDVMITNTRNKSYAPKRKYDPPTLILAQAHHHQLLHFRFLRLMTVKELPPLFPLLNTTF